MSKINIEKIAKLAKIKILDEEKVGLEKQLSKIIDWVDVLSEVNTDEVEILNNIHAKNLTLFEDNIKCEEQMEDVMKNSKGEKYNYFTVPKML